MSTVNKELADKVIERNGVYHEDDPIVTKVVTYNNQFNGGLEYALVYERDDQVRYENSPACDNVKVIWPVQEDAMDVSAVQAFKDHLSGAALGTTVSKAKSSGTCACCKKETSDANLRNETEKREYQISGMCGICWDETFAESED